MGDLWGGREGDWGCYGEMMGMLNYQFLYFMVRSEAVLRDTRRRLLCFLSTPSTLLSHHL